MLSIIGKAYLFAKKRHKGQLYGKRSFISHPHDTARVLKSISKDKNLIAAAYLHDTLEDTKTTYEELVEEFGQDIAGLVREVTKDGYNSFPNLKTQRGVMLKFADRLTNVSQMDNWSEEKKTKYLFEKSRFWK